MIKSIFIGFINVYQKTLSPDHGFIKGAFPFGVCKFRPTCSEYSKQAIEKYGAARGLFLAGKRIIRCHPRSAGGYDPLK